MVQIGNTMTYLKPHIVKQILDTTTNGKMFTVVLVKQNGDLRAMNCRRGVRKYLKGGKSTIAGNPNLVSVYDTLAKDYRCIDITRVLSITANGACVESRALEEKAA